MTHEIDKVSEAVYTHIDKKTGIFNDAAVPMFDPVVNGGPTMTTDDGSTHTTEGGN